MGALTGKKAIVTGGSRGIGAATGIALAKEGAEVILAYFQNKDLAESAKQSIEANGGKAHCIGFDATNAEQTQAFGAEVKATFGRVDVLFNNAGDLIQRATLQEQTPELFQNVMNVNILSTILVTQALRPQLGPGSVVINMSSQAAKDGGGEGASLYAASKGAILSLTKSWAKEFSEDLIRVFALAPGIIDTDFHRRFTDPQILEDFIENSPVGKIGEADDVARAVVFLAQEGSGFMTGNCIDINGGSCLS